MRVFRSHREAPATVPGFSFSETYCSGHLLGLLAGPAASVALTRCRHLAVVIYSKFTGRSAAALFAQDCRRVHALLLEKIINECQRRLEIVAAAGGTILRKIGRRLKNQIGISDEIFERLERCAVGCHTLTVRRAEVRCKR